MNALHFVQNLLENSESQKHLENKVQLLLETVLKNKGEYEQEKAIKSFSEGILYLESLLKYKNGIHHDQIDLIQVSRNPGDYAKKYKEIEDTIKVEIDRQYRHFVTFMS